MTGSADILEALGWAKHRIDALGRMPPRFEFMVLDAQQQARTPRDVIGPWVRPKVPSKRAGRRGTRRLWKRNNPPHHLMFYREPENAIYFEQMGRRVVILTPVQKAALDAATVERRPNTFGNPWSFPS